MPDSKSPLARMGVRTLVDRCLNGDDEAWNVLVCRYNGRVAVYALRASAMLASPGADRSEMCRELIQETYVRLLSDGAKALRAWRGESEASFLAYAASIVHAVACDVRRRERSKKRSAVVVPIDARHGGLSLADVLAASDQDAPDSMLADRQFSGFLERLLASVESGPKGARNALVFQLHVVEGLTTREIAALPSLGMTVGSVETAVRRTRDRLKRALVGGPSASV